MAKNNLLQRAKAFAKDHPARAANPSGSVNISKEKQAHAFIISIKTSGEKLKAYTEAEWRIAISKAFDIEDDGGADMGEFMDAIASWGSDD